ncbi:MAG: glycosyltransferase family 2 protein [Burkholderiaceae bacterium]|nr:glycosyltransferase family 2 protein [Microbacteriaceae bacterium]
MSVIVCAYTQRRWDDLTASVESAIAQPDTTEVILVIDHERELFERAAAAWPQITVVENASRQGLSGARNTGVELASGVIVAFLDDDATAGPGWLRAMLDCFDAADVVAVGGRANPVWPHGLPSVTLPPELLWVVGCTYRGQPTSREDVRNVMGCTMAFIRSPLVDIGGFNLDTGRVGQIPLGAEETEVCIRLRQANPATRIVFEPLSTVSHRVTPDRMTWRYLRRRSFFEGVSKAALSRSLGRGDALESESAYARRILPAGVIRELRQGRPLGAAAIVLSLGAAAAGLAYGTLLRASVAAPARTKMVAP